MLALIVAVLGPIAATAQIQQAWAAHYSNSITDGTNQAVKMALDSSGNIYVTGFSQNTNTNLGYATIKYASSGKQLWAARYDDTNYPAATPSGFALDNNNNVLETGSAVTVKYDTNGNQLWTAPYKGLALAVDTNGDVAVTGFDTIFSTVKINPSGTNLWLQTSPASCGAAVGQSILADLDGDFYVVGSYPFYCDEGVVDYEMLVIKYTSNGGLSWSSTWQTAGALPQVEAATLDNGNNVYLLADFNAPGPSFTTFKYDSGGNLAWISFDPTGDFFSRAHALTLDNANDALVIGQNAYYYPQTQYGAYKINAAGAYVWTNLYPKVPTGNSVGTSIAVDQANNVYVTGYSPGTNSVNDIVTIKYDPNGNQIWLQRYSSPGNGNAAGNAIAVDNTGNVYVTGYDTTTAGGTEIVTIKYSPVTVQRRSDGTVILQAQGSPGESFDIQASADLLNWLDLGPATADTNGLMQFADTNAPNYPARFYYTNPQ
jgi:hypothetical protein